MLKTGGNMAIDKKKKKKSNITSIVILICTGLAFVGMIVALVLSGITKKNPEGTLGNTAGNLYNMGLFCENGNYIYFSNFEDDGTLYRMTKDCTKITKMYSDRIRYINCDGNYLYYARVNNLKASGGSIFTLYNTGLFRIKAKGNAQLLTLDTAPCAALLLCGNNIYYQSYAENEGLRLYTTGTDGKKDYMITQEAIYPACVHNNSLIYSGIAEDRNIWAMDLTTGDKQLLYEGMTYFPIADDDWIYFIDVEDYHVYRTNYGGPKKEVVAKAVCTYNISLDGRYLYYQADRTDDNHIGFIDLKTGVDTRIADGNYKYINVTSNYVFFTTFDETTTYAYAIDGSKGFLFFPGKAK